MHLLLLFMAILHFPLKEPNLLKPISLYGLTKKSCRLFNSKTVGLRYFSVYGKKQSPDSSYAGVISIFLKKILHRQPSQIFGDGSNSRDFIYIDDIVSANSVAATFENQEHQHEIFNIGTGRSTSLIELYDEIEKILIKEGRLTSKVEVEFIKKGKPIF
jgi:nucleoside-diphosphate-sugar epimerase